MNEWRPTIPTQLAIASSTQRLVAEFRSSIDAFDRAVREGQTFGGPSLHFHFQCIAEFAALPVLQKVVNMVFLDSLYATLSSWGMHRMGATSAKLRDFNEFRAQLECLGELLSPIETHMIWALDPDNLGIVEHCLREALDTLTVSRSKTHLVANTKVLHHVLPNLVPPVDRRYTLAFFGINLPEGKSPSSIFLRLYPSFVQCALAHRDFIQSRVDTRHENWHTSFTKVLDNAIIGALT